jgi:hypothetical protein
MENQSRRLERNCLLPTVYCDWNGMVLRENTMVQVDRCCFVTMSPIIRKAELQSFEPL